MTSTKYVYRKDYGQTKLFDDFTYSLEEAQRMFDKEHDIIEEYPDGVNARPHSPSFYDSDVYRPRYPTEEES